MKQYRPQEIAQFTGEEGPRRDNLLRFFQEQARFHVAHIDARPTAENYAEVISCYEEMAEIVVNFDQVYAIVEMSPGFRIKLAEYNGLADTEVNDMALDALAFFLLHSTWPTYNDQVDPTEFLALLKKQALALGYVVISHPE